MNYSTLVTLVSKQSSIDQSELEKYVVSDCKTNYMDHTVFHKNQDIMFCSCVPNCFCCLMGYLVGLRWQRRELKLKKCSILKIFGRLLQVSGKFKKCLILELPEMIRVSHVVACPFLFI